MSTWNNFGGDDRYILGQSDDQIHTIKLKNQILFRRAYSAFGYEANVGKLQPLQTDLDLVIESLVQGLRLSPKEKKEKEKIVSFWKDRVQSNIDGKLMEFYFDLDEDFSTIEKITKKKVVKNIFGLLDPEVKALKNVVIYLNQDPQTPLNIATLNLFNRTIDRLARYYDGTHSTHHPDLSNDDVFSLDNISLYIDNLHTAFNLINPIKY